MTKKEQQFQQVVWDYFREHGRVSLPWRKTRDPYRILVSEVMLQQTQVDRVLPKYAAFLKAFPNVTVLAEASLGEVLVLWQGLGYNRRAKMLHQCAQEIVEKYKGKFPKTEEGLKALPGIGPYTASAVCAFAYNQDVVLIETNVRTVMLYHFFRTKEGITDTEILKMVEKTLPEGQARQWYAALMDYGTHLKREVGNLNQKSHHYKKQSQFSGSDRQIRGALVRYLSQEGKGTRQKLIAGLSQFEDIRIDAQLYKLMEEGMITKNGRYYALPS